MVFGNGKPIAARGYPFDTPLMGAVNFTD